jgi:hypothetical protein
MIPKPAKPLEEASSYGSISLLPIMSKIFEIAVLKRLRPIEKKTESSRIISLDFDRNTLPQNKYTELQR